MTHDPTAARLNSITDRHSVLRTLGLGTAALSTGSLGLLSACGGNPASQTGHGTTTSTSMPRSTRPTTFDPQRPYWEQGNYAPVTVEETLTDLTVKGTIPSQLSGLFVRNGSNSAVGPETLHWFLGDGMVHGVRIERGKAKWYRNRYVQTPIYKARKDLLSFGKVPGKENTQSNVAVVHHAGKLLATGETGWPFELSTADLSTKGAWDFNGKLGNAMTAHPKIDPATGRMHFFGYEFLSPKLTYYVADARGAIDVVSPIPLDKVTMVHDFAITDRDAVFWIGPVMFGQSKDTMYPKIPFHWDPKGPSRVGVMPLDGSGADIRWVDIPPCFVFHGLNAHRDGDDVVLNVSVLDEVFGRTGDLVSSYLSEWRVGTGGDALTFSEKQLFDRPLDLPSHDRRYSGRNTRHGWLATTTSKDSPHGNELLGVSHVDLQTGQSDTWEPGATQRSGEGYFVPASENAPEGEGWILTFIWDRTTDLSSLGIFDAQNMKNGPVAEISLPVRVPFGFHGCWVDEAQL